MFYDKSKIVLPSNNSNGNGLIISDKCSITFTQHQSVSANKRVVSNHNLRFSFFQVETNKSFIVFSIKSSRFQIADFVYLLQWSAVF